MNITKIISLSKTLLSSSPSSRAPSSLIRTIFQSSAEDKEEETFSELQHHIKIDGETVEVMFTADWGRGLSSKQVQEEIDRFTAAMIRIKKEQRIQNGKTEKKDKY